MKRIILDTNFLTLPYQFGIDIFSELKEIMNEKYELATPDAVVSELKCLADGRGKSAVAAKVALKLIDDKKVKVLRTGQTNADKAILDLADENTIVATNDSLLRKKLKDIGIKTTYLKSKKYLEVR